MQVFLLKKHYIQGTAKYGKRKYNAKTRIQINNNF